MENASKALIMAGGVLLTMLVVMLLIFAWGRFTDFYNSEDTLARADNVAQFNTQLSNYDRNNVSGYEIISLVNNVVDYNNRYSNLSGAKNDEQYTPVEVTVDFGTDVNLKMFPYDDSPNKLFTQLEYTASPLENGLEIIIKNGLNVENLYGGKTDVAATVAKNINSLDKDKVEKYYERIGVEMSDDDIEKIIVDKFNELTGKNVSDYSTIESNYLGDEMYKYYEYYQFKKAKFDCDIVTYNNVSGRIDKMVFNFNGTIE